MEFALKLIWAQCDVFAGIGPIAISATKKVKYVYANDLNPSTVDYLEQNIVLNKLARKIEVSNMDGQRFIEYVFTRQKPDPITQVVMNLPNDALEFLDAFSGIPKKFLKATSPKIHVYGFSKADDREFDFMKVNLSLSDHVKKAKHEDRKCIA